MNINSVDVLLGKRLLTVGRCADLIWFGFENNITLHTQCACRISKGEVQLLTRESVYYPNPENKLSISDNEGNEKNEEETVNEYDPKNTLFEHQIEREFNSLLPITVEGIRTNALNDITLYGDKGVIIEVFANSPCGAEQWRLFEHRNEKTSHLVAFGGYTEFH